MELAISRAEKEFPKTAELRRRLRNFRIERITVMVSVALLLVRLLTPLTQNTCVAASTTSGSVYRRTCHLKLFSNFILLLGSSSGLQIDADCMATYH